MKAQVLFLTGGMMPELETKQIADAAVLANGLRGVAELLCKQIDHARRKGLTCDAEILQRMFAEVHTRAESLDFRARAAYVKARNGDR